MSSKYLNLDGLATLWAKIKAKISSKQDAIPSVALKIGDDFITVVHAKAVELGKSDLFYVSASNADIAAGITNGPPGVNNSFRAECFTYWNGAAGSAYKSVIVQVMNATNQKILVGKIIESSSYPTPTAIWTEKQDKLTFDTTPKSGSANPVTSGGIRTAIDAEATSRANADTALDGRIDGFEDLVPTDASATNQLATKAYADAIGERLEARYLGCDTAGDPFPSHAALAGATAYYYQGNPATPDTNDITTVTSDEEHVGDTGQPSTTRYRWNGTGWSFEYVINNTGLNESQLLAVNSGITAAKVATYDGLDAKISSEASARQAADASKLDVDGSNATEVGITAMMKKVPGGSYTLSDNSSYFGDALDDSTKIVRHSVTDLWTYCKGKLGSAGSSSRPVYLDGGEAKECTAGVPFDTIDSGSATGYGVYVGGGNAVGATTRCFVSFLITASANPDMTAHTYVGTFTFRKGSVLDAELKCLTGSPQYPMRISYAFSKNSDSTYTVGVYVIPGTPTVNTYANYKLTRIASSAFTWACSAIDAATCADLETNAKTALAPLTLFFDGGGSNVKTTGGTWLPTFDKATINACRGIVDLSVHVDLSLISQTTYVGTLASYEITLVNSSGTDILTASQHQSGRMPRTTKYTTTSGSTEDISHTHRFVFPITASSNLLAGYRPKITLPSNYALDSTAQVAISATCSGIVLPWYYKDTSF